MGAGWGASVLDQHGELTRIRRRWLRFWLTALGSLIPRTLDFLWQSHPWGYRVGRGELFLASGSKRTSGKPTLCAQQRMYCGVNCILPQIHMWQPSPPRSSERGWTRRRVLTEGKKVQ